MSPAISPQMAVGMFSRSPAVIVISMMRITAGCVGRNMLATRLLTRSTAIVYWVRSFVPMEKKSTSRASTSVMMAALGTSIMMPTFKSRA